MAQDEEAPKVLLVEDEFLIRLTLVEALADDGFAVLEAEDAGQALEHLAAEPGIRVLLTDLQLPGHLDGKALAARAREQHPDLPVIFMTGRPEALGDAPPSPRDLFIAKPYLPSQICTAVRKLSAGA